MEECKKHCGPGYASPEDAIRLAKHEKIIYVTCTHANDANVADYLAVVDVDPKSKTYSQVIHRSFASHVGDEFHHTNWNTCSSCYNKANCVRNKLILPCLKSDRIYVYDTTIAKEPKLFKVIENLKSDYKLSAPHSVHCLASGEVMISTMGDENENAQGAFVLLDGHSFDIKQLWSKQVTEFGYDFWYQPRHNIMVSSSWGAPSAWRKGFSVDDVQNGKYGSKLYFWNWRERELIKTIDLENRGLMALETRFFHNPDRAQGFVGCALSSTVFLIGIDESKECFAKEVISVPSLKVKNWALEEMRAVITDILISMDDRYLFISNWVHGDVRQYDVTDCNAPKLVGQLFIGGSVCDDSDVVVETENFVKPKRPVIKGTPIRGGPQMLQLSLDGKRLYVTTSLFSVWDKQFYPSMASEGGMMLQVDVLPNGAGLKFNENFLVDFGCEPNAPSVAHEMRYPGGDCT
ncbi:selenium-binding protein 1-A-like protein, partial [Leptotrombidium deliense]